MAKVKFSYDDKNLRRNIRQLPAKIDLAVTATVDRSAAIGQARMRTKAPWTDDTGAARNGLFAIPGHFGKQHEIFLTYSVYYGIWLEVANSGRYQILVPMLRIIGESLMRDLEGILNRL